MRDRNYLEKEIFLFLLFFYYKLDVKEKNLVIKRGTKG